MVCTGRYTYKSLHCTGQAFSFSFSFSVWQCVGVRVRREWGEMHGCACFLLNEGDKVEGQRGEEISSRMERIHTVELQPTCGP